MDERNFDTLKVGRWYVNRGRIGMVKHQGPSLWHEDGRCRHYEEETDYDLTHEMPEGWEPVSISRSAVGIYKP
jgi:hypothetical protein